MPGIARGVGDRVIYHVLNCGSDRQEIFHKNENKEFGLESTLRPRGKTKESEKSSLSPFLSAIISYV
jgi:hypothetical protein